nr:transducin/WD40 repeat-like superfamily protein [Tanacetum cinerariifolium]
MAAIQYSIREHTPNVENEETKGISVIIAICDMVGTVLRMNAFPNVVLTPQILWDINCADLATAIAFATRPDLGLETVSSFDVISRNLPAWTERNYSVSREERYHIDDIKYFTEPEMIKSEILTNYGPEGKKYPLIGVFLTNEFMSREVAAAAADGMPFRHQGEIPHHEPGFKSRHGVVIVGVDTTSLNPHEHFVEVKSSYGRRWGREGFSNVAFEEFEIVLVPYYG